MYHHFGFHCFSPCRFMRNRGANPFLRFVGKPYGTYHYALRDTLRKRYDSKKQTVRDECYCADEVASPMRCMTSNGSLRPTL
jgi:hypothetical protein